MSNVPKKLLKFKVSPLKKKKSNSKLNVVRGLGGKGAIQRTGRVESLAFKNKNPFTVSRSQRCFRCWHICLFWIICFAATTVLIPINYLKKWFFKTCLELYKFNKKIRWSQSAFSVSALFGCCVCGQRCATQSDSVLLLCSSVVSVGSCILHCLHLPLHLPGKQISIITSKSCKSRRILWGESNTGKDSESRYCSKWQAKWTFRN